MRRRHAAAFAITLLASACGESAVARAQSPRARVLADLARGEHDRAESGARQLVADSGARSMANLLGQVLVERGKLAPAESAFVAALQATGADSMVAASNLGQLLVMRGRNREAWPLLQYAAREYERRSRMRPEEMIAAARAFRLLGAEDPQAFRSALRAYDRAIAADSSNLDARVELGLMFLEKFNSGDAKATLAGALRADSGHAGALAAEAQRRQFDGEPGASELATRALKRNPKHVPAMLLLANLALGAEDYAAAREQASKALIVNPSSLEAHATLAVAQRASGDQRTFETMRSAIASINPRWSGLSRMMAEHAVRTRRYLDAVQFAREAVRTDRTDWRGYATLGINLLRTGSAAAAKDTLEIAFRGDPYDVWTKNTLDLLDTFDEYVEIPVGRFVLFLDRRNSEILAAYGGPLAEEAFVSLAERYRYRPPTPVRVEMYRNSADFSVRTVGLPGLGALGVAFGSTLAMDSPSARERGSYNWGSTLWHEIAHAFTLGATDHRIPRWVTEGLSVLEERRARPGWGDEPGPVFLTAYLDGKLLPVSRLNDGFSRPTFPEQLGFSYYQASLVMEMIERDFGMEGIRKMLAGYRDGIPATAVAERALGIDPKALDARFDAWFKQRNAAGLEAIRRVRISKAESRRDTTTWIGMLARGEALAREGRIEQAIAALERGKAMYPEYTGPDAAYRQLAEIYATRKRHREAASELAALTALDGNDYESLLLLAGHRESAGDLAGASEALERAIYVYPFEIPVHDRLASLSTRLGAHAKAVRERKVIVALAPVDRAEALYQLARAEHAAGKSAEARKSVLRSLEIAPNYENAQKLLLELASGRPK